MRIGTPLPPLDGATEWRNGSVTPEDLRGHIVLIHFWAVSCGICSEQMPRVNAWRDTLAEKGVRVVSIHMPRYEADTDVAAVEAAIAKYGLTQPCAIDNQHRIADAFGNEFVPAFYLFDAEGKLKSFSAGENAARLVQPALERLLGST
ncbi:TlpA family protein disulfide reductase [Chloracidobacterium thermophilum]|uniref:Thiol-disulfide isomerase / thioredoxin n=1 Tax=Chloracidobacterium thermophilum (strain B) TaxID=981222 RepID=G2LDE0_CHLTF|nr:MULTISPECIES: TlpA disulfide reductase family protein [Chloracidobacterium]AEP12000.1 Thiol-disulfide isomerase / thioredoxin [Chloracidobacterium thermophilum B]QUV79823.1 TlpA family protein disulfide reductase [Chloracidobacterium thermophilum]QUV82844.1 TlpA family protein disulfide reductase [Chloracidobacterium sp. D]